MGTDENKLVKRKKSIFIKIKTFLFNLFEHKKEIAVEKDNEIKVQKDIALNIYKKLISNKLDVYEIPSEYLDVIKEFILKEIEIKKSRLNRLQTEININSYEIEHLIKEKNKYSSQQ